jgi:hypothetical protein
LPAVIRPEGEMAGVGSKAPVIGPVIVEFAVSPTCPTAQVATPVHVGLENKKLKLAKL